MKWLTNHQQRRHEERDLQAAADGDPHRELHPVLHRHHHGGAVFGGVADHRHHNHADKDAGHAEGRGGLLPPSRPESR